MEHWYALHTKTRAEERVANALERRDVDAYLPMLPAWPEEAERSQASPEPLFPGYLFARFDLDSGNPANWKWIPGLRYLVAIGEVAVPVPDSTITAIEHKIRELQARRAEDSSPFKPGDLVRIKDGPFADMLAVFDRACTPSKRVQILLEALDRSYKLKIAPDKIEKAPQGAKGGTKPPRRTRGRGRPNQAVEEQVNAYTIGSLS